MTHAPVRCAARARRRRGWLLLVLPIVGGGCSFLTDEFTWLDRAGPVAAGAPDAPVSVLVEPR